MRGSREISLVPSLHRASTDALIYSILICLSGFWMDIGQPKDFLRGMALYLSHIKYMTSCYQLGAECITKSLFF